MQCNLLHNKIIKDTVSTSFIDGIQNNLVPQLEEMYGEKLGGVLMYEDHLADEFLFLGEWYYPLTVILSGNAEILWIKWNVESKKNFRNGNPYSYVGKAPLEFMIAEDVPENFKTAMQGRAITYDEDALPLQIYATGAEAQMLVGKYSQSFIDEMARQLTFEISSAMSVAGLPESNLELQLVFTPETYMEHTSENVTYRRLLITDYGCQARDFWVKWTRLDGVVGYSISDHVSAGQIKFELGEDVPQKVREKEYRFLCRTNPDKYQYSMGKKMVTEWRELIKRAVKRGDLTKIINDVEIADHASDVSDKLREILGNYGIPVTSTPAVKQVDNFDSEVADMARAAIGENAETDEADDVASSIEVAQDLTDEESQTLLEAAMLDGADATDNDAEASADEGELMTDALPEEEHDFVFTPGFVPFEEPVAEDTEAADSFAFATETEETATETEEIEAEVEETAAETEETEAEVEETIAEVEETIAETEEIEAEVEETAAETETVENEENMETEAVAPAESEPIQPAEQPQLVFEVNENSAYIESEEIKRMREEHIRAELEAKIRLEYEAEARAKAEAEAERLRLESERLKAENERLLAQARLLEEQRLREERLREEEERAKAEAEEARKREEAELRARLEEQARRDAEERARLAEAARIAVEEQRRIEAERREREAREREAKEQEARERERLIREEEERRAELARLEAEKKAHEEALKKAKEEPVIEYMTKHARLIFGRNVDLNVIKRIKEIVEETLVACHKEHIHIHIKAYPIDSYTIHLDITKIPTTETDLLVSIIKAIGNGRIGVTKIFLE